MQSEKMIDVGPKIFFRDFLRRPIFDPIATPIRSILTRPPIPLALFHVRPMLEKADQGRFMALFGCHLRIHDLLWSFGSHRQDRRALFCKAPLHGIRASTGAPTPKRHLEERTQ
jgi:hypothetical protein